jgi:D-serine/D-alanine/glycine transporter
LSEHHLVRGLTNRHIQLIAIGGAIGSFLFVGSAQAIADTGPSVLVIYLLAGITFFFGMRVLGELLLSNLGYKSFRDAAEDILGPRAGFTIGWLYALLWAFICVADATAVATYIQFWWPTFPTWTISVALLAVLAIVNLVTVKAFGEMEFWFAIIKVAAVILIAVFGFVLIDIAFRFPNGMTPDVSNLWSHGGFFTGGASGFFSAFQMAFLAYGGIELVGTTSGETKDPEKTIPRAVNALPLRISLFYIVPLAIILIIAPWTSFTPGTSPFVQVFTLAGVGIAASILNVVLCTAAASGANSGIYAGSRMLYGLAEDREAPHGLGFLSRRKVPLPAVVTIAVVCIAVALLLHVMPNASAAFNVVAAMSSPVFLIVWGMIIVTYIRYCVRRKEQHKASKFRAPGGLAAGIGVLAVFVFCYILGLVEPSSTMGSVLAILFVIIVQIIYTIRHREKRAKAE